MTIFGLGSGVLALAMLMGGLVLALSLSRRSLVPATPPLLRNVSAGSGWASMGCPRPTSPAFAALKEALSPDLTARLAEVFPPGSHAEAVRAALAAQGFQTMAPCEDDPAVHRAVFSQTGGGLAGPYPIHAVVAWRRAENGRLEWTKGFVSYRGP